MRIATTKTTRMKSTSRRRRAKIQRSTGAVTVQVKVLPSFLDHNEKLFSLVSVVINKTLFKAPNGR